MNSFRALKMSDNMEKNDSESSVPVAANAPSRDFLVNTAVHFLQNPKVKDCPLHQKRTFLAHKGLTDEEIDKAIKKASSTSNIQQPMLPLNYADSQQVYRRSFWSRVHGYSSAIIILGIAFYGLRHFYKIYIEPLFYAEKKQEDKLSQLEEQILEVNRSLLHLKKSVSSIEDNLDQQNEQLQKYLKGKNLEMEQCINPSVIIELRSDIGTIKSLLLNRHQFPDVPKISPSIPQWQLVGNSNKKNEREVEKIVEIVQKEEESKNIKCHSDTTCEVKACNDSVASGNVQLTETSLGTVEDGQQAETVITDDVKDN